MFLELSKVKIWQSAHNQPDRDRKYIALAFAGLMRYANNIQQCAEYIVIELQKLNSNGDLPACIIGHCGWRTYDAKGTCLALYDVMGKIRIIMCSGDSSVKLQNPNIPQNPPTRKSKLLKRLKLSKKPAVADVQAVFDVASCLQTFRHVCETADDDPVAAETVCKKMNEYFPRGWNCAEVLTGRDLVVGFGQVESDKLLRFEHATAKRRYIVWAWKK